VPYVRVTEKKFLPELQKVPTECITILPCLTSHFRITCTRARAHTQTHAHTHTQTLKYGLPSSLHLPNKLPIKRVPAVTSSQCRMWAEKWLSNVFQQVLRCLNDRAPPILYVFSIEDVLSKNCGKCLTEARF
jgi:hypothetical protein